jgi:hypothetical protein
MENAMGFETFKPLIASRILFDELEFITEKVALDALLKLVVRGYLNDQ